MWKVCNASGSRNLPTPSLNKGQMCVITTHALLQGFHAPCGTFQCCRLIPTPPAPPRQAGSYSRPMVIELTLSNNRLDRGKSQVATKTVPTPTDCSGVRHASVDARINHAPEFSSALRARRLNAAPQCSIGTLLDPSRCPLVLPSNGGICDAHTRLNWTRQTKGLASHDPGPLMDCQRSR